MRKHLPSIVVSFVLIQRYFIIRAWLMRLAFRLLNGRLFIYRDTPTWLVREMAKESTMGTSEEFIALVTQARNEMYARVRTKRF